MGGICVGEVKEKLESMIEKLLLYFAISSCFYCLNAQQSLDSLRLVLPVTSEKNHNEELVFGNKNHLILIKEFGQIQIWYSRTGKLINSFGNDQDKIICAKLSNDNENVLFSTEKGSFLCQISTGKILLSLEGGGAVFSPDEKIILTVKSSEILLWDRNNGKKIQTIFGVTPIFNHQGSKLLYRAGSDEFFIIDVASGMKEFSIPILEGENLAINDLKFSKDDRKILFSVSDNRFSKKSVAMQKSFSIKVFDLTTKEELFTIYDAKGSYDKASFSNDGSQVLTLLNNNIIQIWDCSNGKCVLSINPYSDLYLKWINVYTLNFSQDGQYILSSGDGFCNLFDSKSGNLIRKYKLLSIKESALSSDNKLVLIHSNSNYQIWDVENDKLLTEIKYDNMLKVNSSDISSSGEFMWTYLSKQGQRQVRLFDLKNFDLVKTFFMPEITYGINASFSYDEKLFFQALIVSGSKKNTREMVVKVYNIENKVENTINTGQTGTEPHALISIDNKYLYTWSSGLISSNEFKIWDLESGKCINVIPNNKTIDALVISPKNNYIAYFYPYDSIIRICNLSNFEEITLFNQKEPLESIEFNSDGNFLISKSDSKTQIWDMNKLNSAISFDEGADSNILKDFNFQIKKRFSVEKDISILWSDGSNERKIEFYNLDNSNYLVKLPNSPYYMCSKDASKMLHYVTPSLKVIGFEQLDPVYNRPDIVLDSIGKYFGNSDRGMITEYRKSWEKRIDRLGLDKEKLGKGEIAVPNAEIVGADAIAYDNKNGKLDIKVIANDPKYPLRRFNVYVNEVPLYGSAGVSIAHLKKQVWDTTVSVPLSMGENKIQVSVMNELGLENFKYPSYVNYTPSEPIVAKTYYIGIAVNEFKEPGHKLNYCVNDVTDLSISFGGPNTEVKLFTNAQVTKENILSLKDYLSKTTVNDKVIISCSSHGLLDDSLNFYLAMHDVDFKNPKVRGLKYEELENLLDSIPARQKLLLLDACNSGENDKSELLKTELSQKEAKLNGSEVLAARGVIVQLEDENKSNFKKMNELFVNVRNNTGSVIISAAGGMESALEGEVILDGKAIKINNGAFTYSILECLKQNEGKELKVNTLKQYAEKRVEEITNSKQQPTSRQETMEVDWGVR